MSIMHARMLLSGAVSRITRGTVCAGQPGLQRMQELLERVRALEAAPAPTPAAEP